MLPMLVSDGHWKELTVVAITVWFMTFETTEPCMPDIMKFSEL